jgi:hypothetical protein
MCAHSTDHSVKQHESRTGQQGIVAAGGYAAISVERRANIIALRRHPMPIISIGLRHSVRAPQLKHPLGCVTAAAALGLQGIGLTRTDPALAGPLEGAC